MTVLGLNEDGRARLQSLWASDADSGRGQIANCDNPKISTFELESRMRFPREYLDFTIWYLRGKKYITAEDKGTSR